MAIVEVKQFEDYTLQYWDVSSSTTWYNGSYIETGAKDTISGDFNTSLIVTEQGAGTYAASVCDSATDGSKSDWYLPSINELTELFNSGVSMANTVWSSTEVDGTDAYAIDLDTGDVLTLNKNVSTLVFKFRKEYTTDVVTIDRMKLQSKDAPILRGGEYNADEDVYKMLGGVYGVSKNSKILSNE